MGGGVGRFYGDVGERVIGGMRMVVGYFRR